MKAGPFGQLSLGQAGLPPVVPYGSSEGPWRIDPERLLSATVAGCLHIPTLAPHDVYVDISRHSGNLQ